jgi:hypothetical protein
MPPDPTEQAREVLARVMRQYGYPGLAEEVEAGQHGHVSIEAMLAFRNAALAEAEQVILALASQGVLHFWDRPGGPPGNGYRPATPEDYARAFALLGDVDGR